MSPRFLSRDIMLIDEGAARVNGLRIEIENEQCNCFIINLPVVQNIV